MNHIEIFQNHFKGVLPEIFFVIAIIAILLYAVVYPTNGATKWLPIQTLLFVAYLNGNTEAVGVIFNNVLIIDDLTVLMREMIILGCFASILISLNYMESQRIHIYEYMILILFSTLGMILTVSSYDLISMYLGIELQTLSFYVLAAFRRNNEFSTEAGLKYFVLGALSSGLLLFGESIIYGSTGITNFEELTKLFTFLGNPMQSNGGAYAEAGLLLMLVAFLFKISAVPFHMWAPDVYEGAPTCVTAFFAIVPKIAIVSLLTRLCLGPFYDLIEWWQQIIIVCSFLSMLIGTFGAINQNRLKRLFAYSSIAHVGYLLIALATGTIEAAESLMLYLIIYMLMNISIFGVILAANAPTPGSGLIYPLSTPYIWPLASRQGFSSSFTLSRASNCLTLIKKKDDSVKYITDLRSLGRSNPVLAATTAAILFSNAGIPPLAGFYGKLNIFSSAVAESMYLLAFAGIICTTMGAFYSIRLVKIIYFHVSAPRPHLEGSQRKWNWTSPKPISKESSIVLAATFLFTLFFFLYPSFLFIITHSAALSLCAC